MKRRSFLATAALLPMGVSSAAAQDREAEIVALLLRMWTTQDWSLADQFLAVDLVDLYPRSTTMPGRESFIQRQASSALYTMVQSLEFVEVTTAVDGDNVLLLASSIGQLSSGQVFDVPVFAIMQLVDGMVAGIHYTFDVDVFNDQIAN